MSPNSKDLEAFTKAVIEEGKVGSDLKTIALALNIDLGKLFTMARRSPEFKLALMQATKHAVEYWCPSPLNLGQIDLSDFGGSGGIEDGSEAIFG